MSSVKFGKEKIELDKDALFLAYLELDRLFNKTMDSDLNNVYFNIEKATGYTYERSLKKISQEPEQKMKGKRRL